MMLRPIHRLIAAALVLSSHGCTDAITTEPSEADLLGAWLFDWNRENPGRGTEPALSRLTFLGNDRYELAGGDLVAANGALRSDRAGAIEYGRFDREGAAYVNWRVDSIVQFARDGATGALTRTVQQGPIFFIEGHPYENARLRLVGRDSLYMTMENSHIGGPIRYTRGWRRVR
jgi:hypothetical protein